MSIGQNIKRLRKRKGLSQKQLANEVGLSEITIRRYERAINNPTTEVVEKIARVLGVSFSELVKEEIKDKKIKPFSPETLYKGEKHTRELQVELYFLHKNKRKYENIDNLSEGLSDEVLTYILLLEKIIKKTEEYYKHIEHGHMIEKKYYMENEKILDKIKELVLNVPSIDNENK